MTVRLLKNNKYQRPNMLNRLIVIFLLIPINCLAASDIVKLYEASKASVVSIVAVDEKDKVLVTGTGFYFADGKKIVTNYHVIEKADEIVLSATLQMLHVATRHTVTRSATYGVDLLLRGAIAYYCHDERRQNIEDRTVTASYTESLQLAPLPPYGARRLCINSIR